MNDPTMNDPGDREYPTPLERLAIVLVTMSAWGWVGERIGLPRWAGRVSGALSVAASSDPSLDPRIRRAGYVGTLPGRLVVDLFKERGPLVATMKETAATMKDRAADVIDVDFASGTTAED